MLFAHHLEECGAVCHKRLFWQAINFFLFIFLLCLFFPITLTECRLFLLNPLTAISFTLLVQPALSTARPLVCLFIRSTCFDCSCPVHSSDQVGIWTAQFLANRIRRTSIVNPFASKERRKSQRCLKSCVFGHDLHASNFFPFWPGVSDYDENHDDGGGSGGGDVEAPFMWPTQIRQKTLEPN